MQKTHYSEANKRSTEHEWYNQLFMALTKQIKQEHVSCKYTTNNNTV